MRDTQLGILDTDDGDTHTLFLGHFDTDGEVAITGNQGSIGNCAVAGQLDQIGDDERIDATLLAGGIDDAGAKMHVGQLGNGPLLR